MAVLTAQNVKKRLRLPIDDPRALVINPLLSNDQFDYDSLDLRLGSHFLLPQVPPQPILRPLQKGNQAHTKVHVPLGSFLVVPSHETILGVTLEFIKLPNDISGQILTKSSVARNFMVIETAPWIHPSYRGCLTLEIANVSNTPLILFPGLTIGQLILIHNDQASNEVVPSGSYVGPIYPETPPHKDWKTELTKIGVKAYRDPQTGAWSSEPPNEI